MVFGHLVARETPPGAHWYDPLRVTVYLFHMPLFMYLSGYVTFLSGAARIAPAEWPRLVRRRAVRLLLPFALFGLAILCGKLVIARFAPVDNVPPDLWFGLRALVWNTRHSPATSVWYIVVLFAFCVVTPLLLALDRSRALLVAAAALLYLLPLPPVLYLDRIGTYFLFFVAGGLAADAGARWSAIVDRVWPYALAALGAVALPVALGWIPFDWSEGNDVFPYKWALLVGGLLSMPAIHGLMRHGIAAQSRMLATLGRYVFVIYLLNTVFIGLTKAVLLCFVPWDGAYFVPVAAAMMVAGTAAARCSQSAGCCRVCRPWIARRTEPHRAIAAAERQPGRQRREPRQPGDAALVAVVRAGQRAGDRGIAEQADQRRDAQRRHRMPPPQRRGQRRQRGQHAQHQRRPVRRLQPVRHAQVPQGLPRGVVAPRLGRREVAMDHRGDGARPCAAARRRWPTMPSWRTEVAQRAAQHRQRLVAQGGVQDRPRLRRHRAWGRRRHRAGWNYSRGNRRNSPAGRRAAGCTAASGCCGQCRRSASIAGPS